MAVTPSTLNAHYSSKAHASIKLNDGTTSSSFGKLLEPGLRKIFFETYAEVPEQFSKIFKVNTSKKAKETDFGLGAFGDWTQRANEFSEVSYGTLDTGYEKVYKHDAFTKGFMIGRELYDDEQYRQIAKFPKAMARAGRAFVEKKAHETLYNAFDGTNHAIFDGKALFAKNHPLVNSASTGCNLMTGNLNDTNLKDALKMMRETVDEAGNLISSSAKKLIVPPSLEFVAKEIVNSSQKAGTDLNDINTVKGSLQVVVDDYLGAAAGGSDSAWYIVDPTICELNFFWRVKPEFKWEEDFDTFAAKYRGYMRFSYGASDWRGICGSQGNAKAMSLSTEAISMAVSKTSQRIEIYNAVGAVTATCSDSTSGHTTCSVATDYSECVIKTGASAATGTVTLTDSIGQTAVIAVTVG